MAASMHQMRLRRGTSLRAEWDCWVDPADGRALRGQLVAAVKRDGGDPDQVLGEYVVEHREQARRGGSWRTFAAAK